MNEGNVAVLGLQWGDESKGKLVDILSEDCEVVVRFQGGANAGHTIVNGDDTYKLHLIPSGLIRGKIGILGHNVAVDLIELFYDEILPLQARGIEITPENLRISDIAPLDLFYHKKLDEATGGKIGTTSRGIGPTYIDRTRRTGLRVCDLSDWDKFKSGVRDAAWGVNCQLDNLGKKDMWLGLQKVEAEIRRLREAREVLMPFIDSDIGRLIDKYDSSLLFEGAQGTFLDKDLGTYPYVTSSNTVLAGAYIGAGRHVSFERVIGVVKAYATRVGNGPFPTEQNNESGNILQGRGGEFGTTTGRPRRCGWLDLALVEEACKINGITEISLAKLDVLDAFSHIPVSVGYNLSGSPIDYFPRTELGFATPVYTAYDGWMGDTSVMSRFDRLPEKARAYVAGVENFLGVPVTSVGVGPKRDQLIKV